MTKPVVWSEWARQDLLEIKQFYNQRNRSTLYSKRLFRNLRNRAEMIESQPYLSRPTSVEGVRGILVSNFKLFFEIKEKHILVLMVWDARRNPDDLESLLKKRLTARNFE